MPDMPSDTVAAGASSLGHDPAAAHLGIEIRELSEGFAKVVGTVPSFMLNGLGTCHGGYLFFIADTAFGAACNEGQPVTMAAEASIVFARPAQAGDQLTATARLRSRFGRNSIYDASVVNRDGELIAEFRGRCVTLRSRVSERS